MDITSVLTSGETARLLLKKFFASVLMSKSDLALYPQGAAP